MGRIAFDTASSLNGWIADEQNSLSWLFAVPGGEEPAEGLFPAHATALVEGSTTYEWVLAESDLLAHPERWTEFHGDRATFVAGQFLDADALDEIAISVAPVALTGDAPLLPRRIESDRLELVSAEAIGQFARIVFRVRR